jgi:hypothetical protein
MVFTEMPQAARLRSARMYSSAAASAHERAFGN